MKKHLRLLICAFALMFIAYACKQEQEQVAPGKKATPDLTPSKREVAAKIHDRNVIETNTPPGVGEFKANKDRQSLTGMQATNNTLGMWLWYLQGTGYTSHTALATDLAAMGVKRVYVKVADGSYNPTAWPEVNDVNLVNAYKSKGLEVWAWSYNYPGNETAQANALYYAAKSGYQGFVTDIEIEFDGLSTGLTTFMQAMAKAKNDAIAAGYATSNFKLYCTTWGNPKDHGMRVDIIDQYVDGHMPQTYVEVWGSTYMQNAATWVNYGTQEYRNLGCKKPIHHIVSAEHQLITSSQINSFIQASGAETSIWRIPGGGTSLNIWNTLRAVNWAVNFGTTQSVTVTVPSYIEVGRSGQYTGTATGSVTKVIATVDGYKIAEVATNSGAYSFNYTFTQAGTNRQLVVKSYNSAGTVVASVTKAITVNTASTSSLTVTMPTSIKTGISAKFSGTASSDIVKIVAYADTYKIAETTTTSGTYSFNYTFNTVGTNRKLTLQGMNASGTIIKTTETFFSVTANAPYVQGVPYFYQYSNSYNPDGSCQNTTIAMIIKYYGGTSVTPDQISNYYGTSQAQTPEGYQTVFNSEAAYFNLKIRDKAHRYGTLTQMRNLLAAGKPVVVHGYLTSYGHVVTVLGFDGTYYYVNDPAGKWSQTYGYGGYSKTNSTEGIAIKYRKDAFEGAIIVDGTIWLHEFYTIP